MWVEDLSKREMILLLELIDRSVRCQSSQQLDGLLQGLRDLVPFQAALTAMTPNGPEGLTAGPVLDYPGPYLAELHRQRLVEVDPIVRRNFSSFDLQYWADTFACLPDPRCREMLAIRSLCEDFGFKEAHEGHGYGYGVRSQFAAGGSLFCFHGLRRSRRTEQILRFAIPHLHQAMAAAARCREATVQLTPREIEVLQWVRAGKSNWEISAILSISERTAKFHLANVCGKLGASTRAHAVAIAMQQGLLSVE